MLLANLGSLEDFTFSVWAKIDPANTGYLFTNNPTAGATLFLKPEPSANRFVLSDRPNAGFGLEIQSYAFDGDWHHLALVRDYAGAVLKLYVDGVLIGTHTARGLTDLSGLKTGDQFTGTLDEFQIWSIARTASEIQSSLNKRLNGTEDGLICYWRFDEGAGNNVGDATGNGFDGAITSAAWVNSAAPAAIPPRYLTIVENNDPSLGGLPVSLKIIRVDDGPYRGDLKILYPDNVFDERLTLRHSSDFAGNPDLIEFEWYYKPDTAGFDPTDLPVVGPDGTITDPRGWIRHSEVGPGINDITIGDGGQAGVLTLGDNWFICRYRGYAIDLRPASLWTVWVGDPAGGATTRAALAEGWVKRVVRGLNPFDARTKDFHSAAVNTFASMLIQAGERYEGDIAFNPSADAINSVGLIEAYATVLNRGKGLSIDGVPPVNFDPANNALLLAASRVSDLYVLLGNEAVADAQDPTIGFSTTGQGGVSQSVYGSLATSIFAFQNQLDSLLEEELALLRGRDDSAAGVGAAPVYNRLLWNFTLGEGEVAYQQAYNISDQNKDGFLDEKDARILYPQGHGDAWGHYLTATTTYYDLLRHPQFTWTPRPESVLVAGTAVQVDFLDERKFARAASAKAKVGAQLVDLTYRLNYVDDPDGQWQGYQDTYRSRAWGVTEWARRAGQGAYFDWLVANAVLPASDPNPDHTGIQKIDRTTVGELTEIPPQYDELQRRVDEADAGMNPFGLAKGAVPFDIDPAQVATGKTHFEQIQDRTLKAMNNAVTVWNEANQATELLRRNQDSVEKFTQNTDDQERDYKNRLIETFGYPYAGDVGPGTTFPSGYDGPDLYHWMYVNTVELNGKTAPPSSKFTGFFSKFHYGVNVEDESRYGAIGGEGDKGADYFYFPNDMADYWRALGAGNPLTNDILQVEYPVAAADFAFVAPDAWGQRRAPGELQLAIGEMVKSQARLRQAQLNYDHLLNKIEDTIYLLQARYDLREDQLHIYNKLTGEKIGIGTAIGALRLTQRVTSTISTRISRISEVAIESVPKVVGLATDAFSAFRGAVKGAMFAGTTTLDAIAVGAEIGQELLKAGLQIAEGVAQADLREADFEYAIKQQVAALEELFRQEATLRVEMFTQKQVLEQAYGKFQSTLAKGQRLLEERLTYRKRVAAQTTEARYQDMTFRIFRNDALQKYRAAFDLAARYVYLAATAYDYEVNLLGTDSRAGRDFLTDIVRQRCLGQMTGSQPVVGQPGLADALGRLGQNFEVLKTQLGFNNPQAETGRFSLRNELFRLKASSGDDWKALLQKKVVPDLWALPEFRAYCRPFAPESGGPQPGLVIRFASTINFGQNFFGWPLSGGDSAYDPSTFATKIRAVGVWFSGYDGSGLAQTPRVYLVPAGLDLLRSPTGNTLATRQWRVVDQALPVPFAIGKSSLNDPRWIPVNDSLGGSFADIRRLASFRAYHDQGYLNPADAVTDSRLIGRSVWNTDWLLIIPGGTLLSDPNQGLDTFINSVSDIKLFFQTYSYAGN